MAVLRDRPYPGQKFLVNLGDGITDGAQAGFLEVRGLECTLDIIEYRSGNEAEGSSRKLVDLSRMSEVTFKRGVNGSLSLYEWFNQSRNGDQNVSRNVTISLLDESRAATVMTWRLLNARPVRLSYGTLDANGRALATEELSLIYERMEIE